MSLDQNMLDRLGSGTAWDQPNITYDFAWFLPKSLEEIGLNPDLFWHMPAAYQAEMTSAMGIWSAVADVTFSQAGADDKPDFHIFGYDDFLQTETDKFGEPLNSASIARSTLGQLGYNDQNFLLIDTLDFDFLNEAIAQNFEFVALHELGHMLGLNHPGFYDANLDDNISYQTHASFEHDTQQYSVMSYFDETNSGGNYWNNTPQTPMLYDIAAIQAMYGANNSTEIGDTTYGFNATAGDEIYDFTKNKSPVMTIWDPNGTNTLDFSGYTQDTVMNLNEGGFSSMAGMTHNLAIAYGTRMHNGVGGSGDDEIIGNAFDNELFGLSGTDTIDGRGGNDSIYGGNNRDHLFGGDGHDRIYGDRNDETGDVSKPSSKHEGYDDEISGDGGNDRLYGELGHDQISGGKGQDWIFGGVGNDSISGDAGNDTIYGDANDETEITGRISTSKNMNDMISGGAGDDDIFGQHGADQIHGDDGNDEISGGKGDDLL